MANRDIYDLAVSPWGNFYTPRKDGKMPNPTPKLTAGLVYTLSDEELGVYINNATRKAFEKAAEIRPPQPRLSEPENMHDYLEGWVDAVAAYTAAIRALAKEQTGD